LSEPNRPATYPRRPLVDIAGSGTDGDYPPGHYDPVPNGLFDSGYPIPPPAVNAMLSGVDPTVINPPAPKTSSVLTGSSFSAARRTVQSSRRTATTGQGILP